MQVTDCPPWDPPVIIDSDAQLPGGLGGPPQSVLQGVGHWCNFDVWVQVPGSWYGVTLELQVQELDVVAVVERRAIADLDLPYLPQGGGAAAAGTQSLSGCLFSIRGRPCTSFDVVAYRSGEALTRGKFRARAWGHEGADRGDRQNRQPFDPFASRAQYVRALLSTAVAGTYDLSWQGGVPGPFAAPFTIAPQNGRVYLTSLSVSNIDLNAAPRLVTLQSLRPTSTPVVQKQWQVPPGALFNEDFTYPLRQAERGSSWQIVLAAAAANHTIAANGFVE